MANQSKVKKTDRTAVNLIRLRLAYVDTMMVKGGTPVPADADGLDIFDRREV